MARISLPGLDQKVIPPLTEYDDVIRGLPFSLVSDPQPHVQVHHLIYATKRYQLVRNITNNGNLLECQSFVVHTELRRLLRRETVKKSLRPMLEFLFVNAVTPVTFVDNVLMLLVFMKTRHAPNKLVWCKKTSLKGSFGWRCAGMNLRTHRKIQDIKKTKIMCSFMSKHIVLRLIEQDGVISYTGTENGSCLGRWNGLRLPWSSPINQSRTIWANVFTMTLACVMTSW